MAFHRFIEIMDALVLLGFSAFIAIITVKTVWRRQRDYILLHGATLNRFHQWWFDLPRINKPT